MREVAVYLDGVLMGSGSLLSQESLPQRTIEFAPQLSDISGSGDLTKKLVKPPWMRRQSKGYRKHVRKMNARDRKGSDG